MRQCLSTVKGGLMYRTLYIHSSNLLAPFAGKPVTHVTCQSSVLVPALTAQPTFIYMMDMPATTLTATATMASARLTSSNASLCGEQVNHWMLATCKFMHNLCFSKVKHCFIFMITLWGVVSCLSLYKGAKPAPGICFERVNSAGDPYGNCGKDSKGSFAKCDAR